MRACKFNLGIMSMSISRAFPTPVDPTTPSEINPPWENVVFQMPMNTLLDQTRRHVVTANGNAHIQSGTTMLGFPCAYFDGTGDYLSTPFSADFNHGSGNFTIECWLIPSSTTVAESRRIVGVADSANNYIGWSLTQKHTGTWEFVWRNATTHKSVAGGSIVTGKLTHLKAEKIGADIFLYQDGIRIASGSEAGSLYALASSLSIGRNGDYNGQYFHGFVGGVRIAKGWASGQEVFLPPVSVFEPTGSTGSQKVSDPNFQNVVLAMPFDGENGLTTDLAGNVVTVNGTGLALDNSKAAFAGSCLSGNGNGWLTVPNSSKFTFTGDFTISAWVYRTNTSAICIFSTGSNHLNLALDEASVYAVVYTTGLAEVVVRSTTPIPLFTPTHVALVKKGSVISLFVAGLKVASATHSGSVFYANSVDVCVGARGFYHDYNLNGYMDDLFICNGWAKWDADFYPPMQKGVVQSLFNSPYYDKYDIAGSTYSQGFAYDGSAQEVFNGGGWNSGQYAGWVQIVLPNSDRKSISGIRFSSLTQHGSCAIRIDGVNVLTDYAFTKGVGYIDIPLNSQTTFNTLWIYCSCSVHWHHMSDLTIKK